MKVSQLASGLRDVVVHLPCAGVTLKLKVRPLPHGYQRRLLAEIPMPCPPAKQQVDRRGNPILVYNWEDPAYKAQLADAQRRQALAGLRYALAEDRTIEWAVPFDPALSLAEIAEATEKELDEANFAVADGVALIRAVIDASGITISDLETAASDFSRTGTGSASGNSTFPRSGV